MKINLSKIIALTLIVVVGMLLFSSGFFIHTHQIDDGSFVVHSHPFNKSNDNSPIKNHKHTKSQLILFDNVILLICITVSLLIFNLICNTTIKWYQKESSVLIINFWTFSPRGPPLS